MKLLIKIPLLLCLFAGTALSVRAQAVPPPASACEPLAAAQLDQLLGPIALYPDPLIAEILPASTFPTQIVLADRYVIGGGDPNQIDQQPWDASVQALARYPSVLKWMDDNLNWTTQVGQAFLSQQPDVMASIQRLRAQASQLGNLQSTSQDQVITDGGDIEIVPADSQVIYVPVYDPNQVYYQSPDGSPFITFGIGWPIGGWLDYDFDWGGGNLIYWGNGYSRPANWWRESSRQRDMNHAGVWRPDNHPGYVAANRGDRGYGGNTVSRSYFSADIRQQLAHPAAQHPEQPAAQNEERPETASRPAPVEVERPANVSRPTPAPVEHAAPVSRPESNGAFIGVQSSQDTRSYSDRGQQSMQSIPRSAPVSRPAPSSGGGGHSSGGGGGGGHSSGGGGSSGKKY
jgi:uncharacterized membrane protein YgcG